MAELWALEDELEDVNGGLDQLNDENRDLKV